MIQLLGLRDYVNPKTNKVEKAERFFERGWRAVNVAELFQNIETYIAQIPEDERYNMYYTAAHCEERKGRIFEAQSVLPIDIDDIDTDKVHEYIPIVLSTLGINEHETGIVATGNGLQFLIGLNDILDSVEYFDTHRVYYKALCGNINQALYLAGLVGSADTSVFSRGRLLRLPLTKNIKEHKGEKFATMLQRNIEYVDFDLIKASGIPAVEYNQQVHTNALKRMPPPDTKGVQEGCEFLKWCIASPDDVSEPQWYAALSIIGRLDNGHELAHKYSSGHSEYNEAETTRKYHQAIEASGPRTCNNISTLWDGCVNCINFQKTKSPICIQSQSHIKTKATGFYNISLDPSGQPKTGKPNYDDLLKHFEHLHKFITIEEGSMTYTWSGSHWVDYPVNKMLAFAEEHFDPKPTQSMCSEFRAKVQRNNLRQAQWFGNTQGMLNFSNGTLHLDTMDMLDHDSDYGFKYVLPFMYNPNATCERFDSFLEEITLGDKPLQKVLLEFMGYALSGIDASIGQKALILTGDGSNGKSVFMDVLKHLAGDGNYATLSMGHEISKLENRYQLDGKLFNVSEETPTNSMMDNTIFKALVTGGEVQARKLYCDAYSMKNTAKIIMACNELPTTRDFSYGMFRRLLIVPFNARFTADREGYDPMLREKLYAEASGIYNRVIDALLRFKRQEGFSDSNTIKEEVQAYKMLNDDVVEWWQDRALPCENNLIPINDLYAIYRIEQEMLGIRAQSIVWFGRSLRTVISEDDQVRTRCNGRVQRCIKNYRLAEATDDDDIQNETV